jgi:hypothetical protein
MSSPPYVKNPYMRAKLVDVMVGLTPKNFGKVLRFNVFERNPLAQKYLTPSLMQFYVEVEHTGGTSNMTHPTPVILIIFPYSSEHAILR